MNTTTQPTNEHNFTPEPIEMSSAVGQVLGTFELLEGIIASLPPHKIFVVQSVSKTWRTVIENSPRIQILMFRKPSRNVLKPSVITSRRDVTFVEYDEEPDFVTCWLLQQVVACKFKSGAKYRTWHGFKLTKDAIDRTSRSYRDLFWTSPPCATASLLVFKLEMHEGRKSLNRATGVRCSVRNGGGLRLNYIMGVAGDVARKMGIFPTTDEVEVGVVLECIVPVCERTRDEWDKSKRERRHVDWTEPDVDGNLAH